MTIALVSNSVTSAPNRLESAVGRIVALSYQFPEKYKNRLLDALTSDVLENLRDQYLLVVEYAVDDVGRYGSLDLVRVRDIAKAEGADLREFIAGLLDLAEPEEPDVVVAEIRAALDEIQEGRILKAQKAIATAQVEIEPPPGDESKKPTAPTAADVAEAFLGSGGETYKFWRGAFYRWNGTHYAEVPNSDLTAGIITFLQEVSRKAAGARGAAEVLANVKALVFVPSNVEPPTFHLPSGSTPASVDLVPMENGIFDVAKFLSGEKEVLTPPTPDLFCLHSLPYEYVPGATCPTFDEIMARNLPDPAHRALLQEWFGLCLVSDSTFETFVIFTGEAGTGKTVACTVLSIMLGPSSVSAIPLETFSPTRTFPLAGLVGKLANVAEEIGECDKAAEGLLKQLVTGSPVTIERKYGEPFQLVNRARLTFATNVLPRFADRSNGIWRRMIVLPFEQVVPPEERDRRFLDRSWWVRSGELPGIFRWALEGLKRLRDRGRFDEPADCRKIREDYKRDANPAATWLRDNCVEEITSTTPSPALYRAYSAYVREQGHHALSEPLFAREVRRQFPLAEKTPNQVFLADGSRARVWQGLRFSGRISS